LSSSLLLLLLCSRTCICSVLCCDMVCQVELRSGSDLLRGRRRKPRPAPGPLLAGARSPAPGS
jgi:hypothetical protein